MISHLQHCSISFTEKLGSSSSGEIRVQQVLTEFHKVKWDIPGRTIRSGMC